MRERATFYALEHIVLTATRQHHFSWWQKWNGSFYLDNEPNVCHIGIPSFLLLISPPMQWLLFVNLDHVSLTINQGYFFCDLGLKPIRPSLTWSSRINIKSIVFLQLSAFLCPSFCKKIHSNKWDVTLFQSSVYVVLEIQKWNFSQ